ncbi:MAG: ECF transporter S component [Clostridia bacterium]|nr:ECF transporter S component [Clostridia bacterium]
MSIVSKTNKKGMSTERLVLLSLLTALVAILSYFGGFIKIGGLASISLTLVPVVIGAALCGPLAGAWLGGVSAVVFFMTVDAIFWFGLSIPGTVITVMVKGIAAGLAAGYVFKLLEKYNRYVAIVASALVAPIVNTGIFLIGCLIFFIDTVSAGASAEGMSIGGYLIIFFVGLNFVFEVLVNMLLSPAIARIIDIAEKNFKKKSPAKKVPEKENTENAAD